MPTSTIRAPGYSVFTSHDNRGLETNARFGSDGGPGLSYDDDAAGRLSHSTTNVDGTIRTFDFSYDANGNRTSLRKRDGAVIGYAYDALNRVFRKDVPASAGGAAGYSVFTTHDNGGLETNARFGSPSGPGLTNAYDNAGRLASASTNMDGTVRTFISAYDGDGNRTSIAGPDFYTGWDYDGADRATAVRDNSGAVTNAIRYDAAGRRSALNHGLGGGSVSSTAYSYDAAGRLSALNQTLRAPRPTRPSRSATIPRARS